VVAPVGVSSCTLNSSQALNQGAHGPANRQTGTNAVGESMARRWNDQVTEDQQTPAIATEDVTTKPKEA